MMLKFKKSELFKYNGYDYVIKSLAYKLLETRAGQRAYDSALTVKHPIKGEMVRIPQNVKFETVK